MPAEVNDRQTRLDQIINDTLAHLESGGTISIEELTEAHHDLMPELGERLDVLSMVVEARATAEEITENDSSSEASIVHEQMQLLQAELQGYRIVHPIHRGGQGAVYRATETATNRAVAVKVLSGGPFSSDRQRQRFIREVQLTARLRHPHIVTVFRSGVVREHPYYVMEYVDGQPITDHAILMELSARDRVRLFISVVRAVSHAHQRGIIHRDLKPSNILVDGEGEPHILDFGLAKAIDAAENESDELSVAGSVVGTLPYISPEQATGAGELDTRSDVYSLAVVFFELLAGAFPYSVEGDRHEIRERILHDTPFRIVDALSAAGEEGYPAVDEIDLDLEYVVARALAKDPRDRYQSADTFADDLERVLRREAIAARSDHNAYLLRKALRKYRVHAAIAGAFVAVLVTAGVVAMQSWITARAQRDNARKAARLAHGTLDQVVTEIDDAIRPLPGGLEVRDRLLLGVAARLEELQPLLASDESMMDVEAALSEKLGDIAYAQGRHSDAESHYQASQGEFEPSVQMDRRALVTGVRRYLKAARAADDNAEYLNLAEQVASFLPEGDATDVADAVLHGEIALAFSRHHYVESRFPESIDYAERAVSLFGLAHESDPADRRAAVLLTEASNRLGQARGRSGDRAGSFAAMLDARRLCNELVAAYPHDVELLEMAIVINMALGDLHRRADSFDEAVSAFEAAGEIGIRLTEADPDSAAFIRLLLNVHDRITRLYLDEGRPEDARFHCELANDLARQLIVREPENPEWRRLSAFTSARKGRLLMDTGQLDEALVVLKGCVDTRDRVFRETGSPADASCLALDWDNLGRCYRLLDQFEQSRDCYMRGLELRQDVIADDPDSVESELDVILSKSKLATWHLDQRTCTDAQSAIPLLDKIVADLQRLQDTGRLQGRERIFRTWMQATRKNIDLARRQIERYCPESDE